MSELPNNLDQIKEMREKLKIQEQLLLKKSMMSDDPTAIMKANAYFKDVVDRGNGNTKSFIFDPWIFHSQFGYKDKPTNMSYDLLRRMSKTPLINAIISTRVEQVAAFSQPQKDKYSVGFKVEKKRSLFSKEKKLTRKDEAKIEYITDFLLNCGNPTNSWHGDTFDTFLRKFTRDALVLDQGTFEVVRNRKGDPEEFLAVDAATFRLADTVDEDEYKSKSKLEINGYLPSYVQIYQNQIVTDFYPWELCFLVRNHYTDVRMNGYGISELETIVNIVTWMLYSDTYNGKFFSQGSAPKGILKISGNLNEARLAEFRQQWMAMVAGVQNAWRTPVLEGDKVDWIDLQKGNRDMEFTAWQEYLIKVACSSYKIDPSEIGFHLSGSSDSSPMFESNNEHRLKFSRDKGLRPLLKAIETKINKYIVNAIDQDFEFKFVGIDSDTEQSRIDLDIKKAAQFMSLKEVRKLHDLPEEIEEDDVILNPQYIQYLSQQQVNEESDQVVDEMYGEQDKDDDNYDKFSQDRYKSEDDTEKFFKSLDKLLE